MLPDLSALTLDTKAKPDGSAPPPSMIFLTSHNTAIAPAVVSGDNPYHKRTKVWFESVAEQPFPVLVELDKNAPAFGAFQNCSTLSHIVDSALDHKTVLKLLQEVSSRCDLVVLYDFKSPVDPRVKSSSCEVHWTDMLNSAGVKFRQRTSFKKPRSCEKGNTCQFFSLDTKKNSQCFTIDSSTEDEHRKTYNAGGAPLLSPLFATLNCESDCLAHDGWQMRNVRDCLVRALHTTPDQKLSGQPTDFARIRLRVVTDPPTVVAYMSFGLEEPETLISMDSSGAVDIDTAASFACVALKRGQRWQAFRVFTGEATVVEEPISAYVFEDTGYTAATPVERQGVTLVQFQAAYIESDPPSNTLTRRVSQLLRRSSAAE